LNPIETFEEVDRYLEQMVEHQRAKVLRIAREVNPVLTADDILNPQDFPALVGDEAFNYEDGLLAGMISAKIALRARFLLPAREAEQSYKDR
jgi:hypothetical protein